MDITTDSDVTNDFDDITFYPAIGVFTEDKKRPKFFGITTLEAEKALRFIEKQLKIEYLNRISKFTGERMLSEDDFEDEVEIEEEQVRPKEKDLVKRKRSSKGKVSDEDVFVLTNENFD